MLSCVLPVLCPSAADGLLLLADWRGKPKSPEWKEAMSRSRQGRKLPSWPQEARERASRTRKLLYLTTDIRERISESLKGKPKHCRICGEAGHNYLTCPQE